MARKKKNDWYLLLLLLLLFVILWWMATRQKASATPGLPIVTGVCEPNYGTSFQLPPPICIQANSFPL